jgi:hypothetical protein
LNKLSGFYGLISLEYNDKIALCAHIYSLLALGVFSYALYGITKVITITNSDNDNDDDDIELLPFFFKKKIGQVQSSALVRYILLDRLFC